MTIEDRSRSRRDRPAKAPLSRDAVLDAALGILQTEGLAGVTMRRVAVALDTGPASLYVYVANREALLQAMLDRVVAGIVREPLDPARWREQLHALLRRVHAALVGHPGIAAATLADPPPTETVLLLNEHLLGLLVAGGVGADDAVWTADILVLLVTASAIEEDELTARGRVADHQDRAAELGGIIAALPADRFPLTIAHASRMAAGVGDERLRFGIDVVLDGVVARAGRS